MTITRSLSISTAPGPAKITTTCFLNESTSKSSLCEHHKTKRTVIFQRLRMFKVLVSNSWNLNGGDLLCGVHGR